MTRSVQRSSFVQLVFVTITGPSSLLAQPAAVTSVTQNHVPTQFFAIPRIFEENRGQIDPSVRFLSRGSGYSLYFTDHDVLISSHDGSQLVRMSIPGAARGVRVRGEHKLEGTVNYLSGGDKSRSIAGIPVYAGVRYADVYPGVDLLYHASGQQMEFDFTVAPKSDPRPIRLRFSGARGLRVDDAGNLLVNAGREELLLHKPVVYQGTIGERRAVDGAYRVLDRHTAGFVVGDYDPAETLVIDPTLSYATYISPATESNATGVTMTVDGSGNAYIAGSTTSVNVPITPGALQTGIFTGKTTLTGFVAKLNPAGTALVYATYLGGEGIDAVGNIAVDATGAAYVVGGTTSKQFPITKGAYQTSCTGYCGFVAKLSPSGGSLIYSTYLGNAAGFAAEPFVTGIALNSADNAYVTGLANSATFPTTPGALMTSTTNTTPGFVAELDPQGASLVYSTLFAGSGLTFVIGIALDSGGNAYVTGFSAGSVPVTPGAYQTTNGGGFVSKIDPHGAKLVYSTLIGGAGLTDTPSSIAVDSNGNAYITGLSQSKVYPTTPGAFQTKGGGVFVTKFNPAGTALVYSTFLNPNGSPSGFLPAITVDGAGNAYVTGLMGGGLPTTSGAFKSTGSGGFLTVLDAAADTAVYSSYIGGDEGTAIALDSSGNVYVAGAASSANVPATTGAFKSAPIAGGANAFVVKFSFPATTQPAISGVVNGASSVAGVVAGSFASIYGSNLSPATDVWDKSIVNGALPIALDGVSVMVGGKPAYLSYISPGQINFLAPDIAAGPVSVTVNNGSAISAPYNATVIAYQPAFFLIPNNQPVATHVDYTLAAKNGTYPGVTTVPAHPGETIILWGTGFGPTNPGAPDGMVVPSTATYSTSTAPMINISSQPAQVLGAALAPGFAGLYQIAIQVPAGLANGDWPILATIGGAQSEAGILLTVQQ